MWPASSRPCIPHASLALEAREGHASTHPFPFPPQQEIRAAIAKSDTSTLHQEMHKSYSTTFTAEELAFIADYSNSELGKRVQRKMSQYVAKVREKKRRKWDA